VALWAPVLASIIASTTAAGLLPGDAVPVVSADPAPPAVHVRVLGDSADPRVSLLRGASAVRVIEQGGCLTTGPADLSVEIDVGRDATSIAIDDGTTVRRHVAPGSDSLAALEVLHRLEAGLRSAAPTIAYGPACRDVAIGVTARGELDARWIGQWIAGLSRSGRSIVRSHDEDSQVCLRRDADAFVVGRGRDCSDAVRVPAESGDTDESAVDQAVGAALALSSETAVANEPAHEPEPIVEPARDDAPLGTPVPTSPTPAPKRLRATLHAFAGGGPSIRPGGLDGAALFGAGAALGPGVLVAAEAMVLPSRMRHKVVAVDTDVLASVGYRLALSKRSGLRGTALAGARVHTWRVDGGATRLGETTWVVGGDLAGWWRVGRYVCLEFGLRQQFAGRGWIHEVGLLRAGERGRSTTTVFAGVGWIGRRR
jgi:hypothetical protein